MNSAIAFLTTVLGAVLIAALPQSVNVFTTTFLPLDPPFVCKSSKRAQQMGSAPLVFHAASQEDQESELTLNETVFAAAADPHVSELIYQLEQDLLRGDSPHLQSRTSTEKDAVPSEKYLGKLMRALSHTLFPDAPELDEDNALSGVASIIGWIGSSKILICAAIELAKSLMHPKNIATILCKCMQKHPREESQCLILSPVSSSKLSD